MAYLALKSFSALPHTPQDFREGGIYNCTPVPVAAHLLGLWVRILPGAWIFVCCECRVSSGRGLCNELITRPEECYRFWCVVVCDLETSRIGAPFIYDISSLRVKSGMSDKRWNDCPGMEGTLE